MSNVAVSVFLTVLFIPVSFVVIGIAVDWGVEVRFGIYAEHRADQQSLIALYLIAGGVWALVWLATFALLWAYSLPSKNN